MPPKTKAGKSKSPVEKGQKLAAKVIQEVPESGDENVATKSTAAFSKATN
jgi:hypothetical protein